MITVKLLIGCIRIKLPERWGHPCLFIICSNKKDKLWSQKIVKSAVSFQNGVRAELKGFWVDFLPFAVRVLKSTNLATSTSGCRCMKCPLVHVWLPAWVCARVFIFSDPKFRSHSHCYDGAIKTHGTFLNSNNGTVAFPCVLLKMLVSPSKE